MLRLIKPFIQDDSGATAIEYSLIASLVGLVIISGTRKIGTSVSSKFGAVANGLT
jgi:pilus assembly protein Flp/PilA